MGQQTQGTAGPFPACMQKKSQEGNIFSWIFHAWRGAQSQVQHGQSPLQRCSPCPLPAELCLATAPPPFPPCPESPKATSCFHLPHSPACRCYTRPHFVLHLIPFERGQRRIAREGGKGTAESGRGDRKAHEQQQKTSTTR